MKTGPKAVGRLVLPAIVLLPSMTSAQAAPASTHCQYSFTTEHLRVRQGQVTVDLYRPIDNGMHPLIVMIHGSVGVFTHPDDQAPKEDNFGERRLAQNCFIVALPHYLEPFGMKSITGIPEMRRMFSSILAELQDISRQLETVPGVEKKKVGLYGESYGGYVAVALAASDPAVQAVSEYSGGPPAGYGFHRSAPQFLIQHGGADTVVPVKEAYRLRNEVMAAGARATLVTYPGQTHYFDEETRFAVLERSVDFFLRRLK